MREEDGRKKGNKNVESKINDNGYYVKVNVNWATGRGMLRVQRNRVSANNERPTILNRQRIADAGCRSGGAVIETKVAPPMWP